MRVTIGGLDLLVVLLFAVAGHASHYGAVTFAGVLGIAWPFAVGAIAGGTIVALAGWTMHHLRAALVIWPVTVTIGMALRWLTGSGTAWSFMLVAIAVLGLGLFGWRALAALVRLGQPRKPRPAARGLVERELDERRPADRPPAEQHRTQADSTGGMT